MLITEMPLYYFGEVFFIASLCVLNVNSRLVRLASIYVKFRVEVCFTNEPFDIVAKIFIFLLQHGLRMV